MLFGRSWPPAISEPLGCGPKRTSIARRLGIDSARGERTPRDRKETALDWRLELVVVPVSDVERAKKFYVDQLGFHADHDHVVSDEVRFVQLTPPGSACSIALGT